MDRKHRASAAAPEQYRHRQRYRVRFADLDTYQHVNNKAFLAYVEDARVRYLVDVGGFKHHYDGRDGVMVVHVSIDYINQINAFEQVTVGTRCTRLGKRSFTLQHLLQAGPETAEADSDDADRRVAAVATTVFASVDMQTGRSRPNDPEMITRIREYERDTPESDT